MTFWSQFVLAVLATWRITHLLACEDGPADLNVRFRSWLGDSVLGKLLDCFQCLSLWIAAPFALFFARAFTSWLVSWLALSGAACILERLRPPSTMLEPVVQSTQGELSHVLRSETLDAPE
jgi:hypothetical protein